MFNRLLCLVGAITVAALVNAADLSRPLEKARSLLNSGDYQAAYAEFEKHAERGNPLAYFNLALFHSFGWGMAVDKEQACLHHAKAAEGDIPAAAHFYAECIVARADEQKDYPLAAKWYRRAAELGHHGSYCYLAELYMEGKGVAKDPHEAITLCLQSAEQDSVPSQLRLANFYRHGDMSIRDKDAALHWYRIAAQKGSAEGAFRLARMLQQGGAQSAELTQALQWYEYAASQGYPDAYLPTGNLYLQVRDEADKLPAEALAKAYMWLSAAKQRISGDDAAAIQKSLDWISGVMPEEWLPDLNAKVEAHLAQFADNKASSK